VTAAILAAVAMLVQDLIAVPLVQAEARNRAHLAGLLDTVGWLVAIFTTFISVDTLQGHNTADKVAVVVLVSLANYTGTLLGTKLGRRFVKEDASNLADRVAALERSAGQHHH
jgi:hypothetical protein